MSFLRQKYAQKCYLKTTNTTLCIDAIEIQKTLTYKCMSSIDDS